jgi:hypothetical protein
VRPCRVVVALLAAATLVVAPASAAPRSVGVVLHADKARVGSGEALSGATIFTGDTLSTSAEGTLRVRLATAQIFLQPNTTVAMEEAQGWHIANLREGGVGFSTTGDERVVVRTADAQVYASTTQPTIAEVQLLSANELLVTSVQGPLEVMVGSEVRTVPGPGVYHMVLEAEPQATQGAGRTGPGAPQVNKRRILAFILIPSAVAAGITGIVLYNTRDPASPFTPTFRPLPFNK